MDPVGDVSCCSLLYYGVIIGSGGFKPWWFEWFSRGVFPIRKNEEDASLNCAILWWNHDDVEVKVYSDFWPKSSSNHLNSPSIVRSWIWVWILRHSLLIRVPVEQISFLSFDLPFVERWAFLSFSFMEDRQQWWIFIYGKRQKHAIFTVSWAIQWFLIVNLLNWVPFLNLFTDEDMLLLL